MINEKTKKEILEVLEKNGLDGNFHLVVVDQKGQATEMGCNENSWLELEMIRRSTEQIFGLSKCQINDN